MERPVKGKDIRNCRGDAMDRPVKRETTLETVGAAFMPPADKVRGNG